MAGDRVEHKHRCLHRLSKKSEQVIKRGGCTAVGAAQARFELS